MPFGISPAPEIFHRIVSQSVDNLPGVVSTFVDDLMVHGRTDEEHDNRLRALISRLSKLGFTVNPEKCQLKKNEVKYLGYMSAKILSSQTQRR